jgi:hypothetical protein
MVNFELEWIWKVSVMAYSMYYLTMKWLSQTTNNLTHDNWCCCLSRLEPIIRAKCKCTALPVAHSAVWACSTLWRDQKYVHSVGIVSLVELWIIFKWCERER